jgi:ABC-type Fe3+-hydroxamate transport system substrate-binding protein
MTDIPLDAVGVQHEPAGPGSRIVSLVPSITELLFDLDLDEQMVGRTQFCVHPEGRVADVTSLGGTKKINMDRLRDLEPTHVILNVDENTKVLAHEISKTVPHIIVTHPMVPRDNIDLFRLMGGVFRREAPAEKLCTAFEKALRAVSVAVRRSPERRALYFVWKDPWMTVSRNTYISRMLDIIRWRTILSDPAVRYPKIEITKSVLSKADVLLFSSEPYKFGEEDIEIFRETYDCGGKMLRMVDGEMISWYGSRAIKGLEYLQSLAARRT